MRTTVDISSGMPLSTHLPRNSKCIWNLCNICKTTCIWSLQIRLCPSLYYITIPSFQKIDPRFPPSQFLFFRGPLTSVTTLPRLNSDCQGQIDRGSCSSPIQMWAYDKKKGRCVPFTYGGCGGNLNRFFSRDQCQQTCETSTTTSSTTTRKSLSTTPMKYVIKTKSACLRPRVSRINLWREKFKS